MKKILIASALLFSFGSVHAADALRWDSVAVSFESADIDGDKFKGFGLYGTKLLGENVFIDGSYRSASDDYELFNTSVDVDLNRLTLGLGYRYALTNTTDFFGIVSYEDIEIEASAQGQSESQSENGFGLTAGVRSLVTDNFELKGSLGYLDIADESETSYSASATYHFSSNISASVGYSKIDVADFISVSAVYFF